MTWTIVLPRPIRSLNVSSRTHWSSYARERKWWTVALSGWSMAARIPPAEGKRRVTLVRVYSGRQRELDEDNLQGGSKCVIDALKPCGKRAGRVVYGANVIRDDDAKWLERVYRQERGTRSETRITVEDM